MINKFLKIFGLQLFKIKTHPKSYIDYECGFTANCLNKFQPKEILDIGSYRYFTLGVSAFCKVTSIDIRKIKSTSSNEEIITCDAKKLPFEDNKFDAVVSLCGLEHFGLGRYGDEVDPEADKKAFKEMVRVLKPDGCLIFTTTINNAEFQIDSNRHRIYNYEKIKEFCTGLYLIKEKFYSHGLNKFCPLKDITSTPLLWDVYCGCYKKPRTK